MELLYIYIKDVGRPIKHIGFNFSNNFHVLYDESENEIKIEVKNSNRKDVIENLYGENIKNITLIVGENGCGKTTIMDLLGLNQYDLQRAMLDDIHSDDRGWFILYHLEEDKFVIEGYNPVLLPKGEISQYLQMFYSAYFEYDTEKTRIKTSISAFKHSHNKRTDDYVNRFVALSYQGNDGTSWYYNKKLKDEKNIGVLLNRYHIKMGYATLIRYVCNSRNNEHNKMNNDLSCLSASFNVDNVKFIISLHQRTLQLSSNSNYNNLAIIDGIDALIYGCNDIKHVQYQPDINKAFNQANVFNSSESLALMYLEEIARYLLIEQDKVTDQEKLKELLCRNYSASADDYKERRTYLLTFIKDFADRFDPMAYSPWFSINDYLLTEQICTCLEKIPEEICQNYGEGKTYVDATYEQNDFLEKIGEILDISKESNLGYYFNQIRIIDLQVHGMSSGEKLCVNVMAGIFDGIVRCPALSKREVLLLLDEPDEKFHPEWSRQFINTLVTMLKSDLLKHWQYQIVITTHSPLLLSDVIKENIIRLERKENSIVQIPTPYGFAGNLLDIMLDSFFVKSPFGMFAQEYVERLLNDIREAHDDMNLDDSNIKLCKYNEMMNRARLIDDEIIRTNLIRRISSLGEQMTYSGENTYDKS